MYASTSYLMVAYIAEMQRKRIWIVRDRAKRVTLKLWLDSAIA